MLYILYSYKRLRYFFSELYQSNILLDIFIWCVSFLRERFQLFSVMTPIFVSEKVYCASVPISLNQTACTLHGSRKFSMF